MAIQSKRNFLGAMRIDTNMLRAIESGVVSDFGTLVNNVLGSGDPNIQTYVVRGFAHTGTTKSTFTISLADSVFISQNAERSMFVFPSDTPDVVPFLNEVPNTYYWGFRVQETDAVVQQFAFKDPITNVEYTKTVPTAKELRYIEPYYDTQGTRSDVTFIYKITVGVSGTVTVNGLADVPTNQTKYFLMFGENHYDSLTEWASAVNASTTSVTMEGDVTGQSDDTTVVGLQGKLFEGNPTNGQVPVYSTAGGGKWVFGASNAVASATFYVATDGSDTTGNGSLTAPFATITKAQNEADGLTGDVFAAIELLPGTYVEDVTIYRHNTILRGLQASSKGESHKIIGSVTVDCTTATEKFNEVVAIQGLFIQPPTSSSDAAVKVTGSGLFSVLIDNCYLTTGNGDGSANALLVDNDNPERVRVAVSNSVLTIQEGGPDIVSFEHGDGRMDSCELYFGSEVDADTVSGAIVIDNAASLFADRLLIDISSINEAVHVTGGTNWPKLTLSNSSINNRYDGVNSHCIYMDISSPATPALFSWQNAFTVRNATASAIINNTGTTPAIVIHGQSTFVPNAAGLINKNVTNCTLSPMTEMHGNLVIPSKKAPASSTYALTIDENGNVGSQALTSGQVSSVGNASGDTSVTVAGTGSGPWTGDITVKLPDVITAGGPIGSNGVTIPVITYDKYGRLTTVDSAPLNIEYAAGQYKTVKEYVDDLAFGLSGKDPVAAATTAPLVDAYNVSLDGLTLTKTTNGALGTIDGVTPTVGMRLLIKNETSTKAPNNGIYEVTVVGNGSTPWQLDRTDDANTPTSLCGSLVPVETTSPANTNGGTLWTFAKNPTGFTIGTDDVVFIEITNAVPNATSTVKGVVKLAGALGGTSSSADTPIVDLGTDSNFSGVLSLAKVKGPSSAKAVGVSTTANTWSATGLTGLSQLVGFIADGTPTAITLGTNLSLSGSTLNAVLTGAVSSIIAGTGVSVSAATGDVIVSIGQSVATSAAPTFAGLSILGGGANAVKLGDATSKITTLEMNTTSSWTGIFGALVKLDSTTGIHLNTDITNGGNVNLSKSGSTTTVGGNLTLSSIVNGFLKVNGSGVVSASTITATDITGNFPANRVTDIPYDISGEVFGTPPSSTVVYHYRAPRKIVISNSKPTHELGIACGTAGSGGTSTFRVYKYLANQTSPVLLFTFVFASGSLIPTVTINSLNALDFVVDAGQHIFVETVEINSSIKNVWFTFAGVIG